MKDKSSSKALTKTEQYKQTWETIKENRSITIQANPSNHAKIKKALANQKDLDSSWPEKRYFALRSRAFPEDPTRIEFYLELYRKGEIAGVVV